MFPSSRRSVRAAIAALLVGAVLLGLSDLVPSMQAAGIGRTAASLALGPAQAPRPPEYATPVYPPPPPPLTRDMQVFLYEMTLVQLVSEEDGYAKTVCAGNGLVNVRSSPWGPIVIIPNAGDLSAGGSNVAVKLMPDRVAFFIPRTQGQLIRVPMDVGNKVSGQEVPILTFDEGMWLMAAGQLIWTARDQGPYHDGRGIPGHIAACDPWYSPDD